jgi:hypothetical protein
MDNVKFTNKYSFRLHFLVQQDFQFANFHETRAWEAIFIKKNSYTDFRGNPPNSLFADNRSHN